MSDASTNAARQNVAQKPLPPWITSGILGLVLGGGGCFMAMYYHYAPPLESTYQGVGASAPAEAAASSEGGGGGAPGGMMGGGMMGGGMMRGGMGGGMMGGGMGGGMMGGGMGGGGGPRGKRNLTSLVGKLDLASKGIPFRLDSEQSAKLAAQLTDLDEPEKMTQEEAQERVDAIEALLTDEQKGTLALFDIPRGGGGGAASGPGGGGGPGGAPAADDGNPFQQETNQSRLQSLLGRLKSAPVTSE